MSVLNKINTDEIKIGVVFSAAVFFDDGQNMFMAAFSPAKKYHIEALRRYHIPYLLSAGHKIDNYKTSIDCRAEEVEEL